MNHGKDLQNSSAIKVEVQACPKGIKNGQNKAIKPIDQIHES